MPTKKLDGATYRSTTDMEGVVLVSCHASWCRVCEGFRPVYEQAAARHARHVFGTLDVRKNAALSRELGIEHVPTLMLYRDGLLLFRQTGVFDAASLDDIVRQAESLDMELVRAEIEAETAGAA